MILKNLLRRKARTFLTILGIAIGVAAIIALGVMSNLLENGYSSMMAGSKSDLLLTQPDAFSLTSSAIDEQIGQQLQNMPEVAQVSGMILGVVQTVENPFFFVFGYPKNSYLLERYQITAGVGLDDPGNDRLRGKPLLIGLAAAEALGKQPGDSMRLGSSLYRIVGVYQTGDAFEDRGVIISLQDAQLQFDRANKVSLFYIQLKDLALRSQLEKRAARLWPDLALSSTDAYASKESMIGVLRAYVMGIAGLAIILGAVGMMNAQLMSVIERTREIGVLRAVGWSSLRVLVMILGESFLVSLSGGALGIGLGLLALRGMGVLSPLLDNMVNQINLDHITRAISVVLPVGLIGGAYPAWRASRLQPVEALRYEGGATGAGLRRLPVGGMAVQSLWQRSARTLLTLSAIGITVGAIMALEGVVLGMASAMVKITTGSGAEIMVRERNAAASNLSSIDERVASRIAVLPGVAQVSRMVFTAITLPEQGSLFMLQGYALGETGINRFPIVEGNALTGNRQIILGRIMANSLNKQVGDTIELSGKRFRIVGIFETGVSWEEIGGVVTLRDAQAIIGQPRKVSMLAVNVSNPSQAAQLVEQINQRSPAVRADLTGEFVEQLPDMQYTNVVMGGISVLAIFVGGLAVLNTMLMAVMERTREIGVLRAVGWNRGRVLGLILREALILGILGGVSGVGIAFGLAGLMQSMPGMGQAIDPIWTVDIFLKASVVALLLSLIGGIYPAYRATRLQPTEALRYE
jgi:ABC-type antimicrobial peptide transport system permease subunit